MNSRITLLRPVVAQDEFYAEDVTYVPTRTIWAEKRKMTGRNVAEVGEPFPEYAAEYNIYDAHEVAENWRVQEEGKRGHLYNVSNVIWNKERQMLTLQCDRINK